LIDITTGLPELPEGYWWDVKADKKLQRMIDTYCIYDHGYSVNIVKNYPQTSVLKRKHWWSLTKTYVTVPPYTKDLVMESTFILKSDVMRALDSTDLATTITPEAVLKAAQRCKDTYDRRIESYMLIGKYPPNKLVTKKDDNV
jgi:hypothetical protein